MSSAEPKPPYDFKDYETYVPEVGGKTPKPPSNNAKWEIGPNLSALLVTTVIVLGMVLMFLFGKYPH